MDSDLFFQSQCQGVSLAGNGGSLVSDGRCKHCTKPTHTSHSRTRDVSRLAQDLCHRVDRIRSVSHKASRSSHPAQHLARALVVVSCTLEHYLTFHMRSSPTCYPTICQILRCCPHHAEIYPARIHRTCLSALWLKRTRLKVTTHGSH